MDSIKDKNEGALLLASQYHCNRKLTVQTLSGNTDSTACIVCIDCGQSGRPSDITYFLSHLVQIGQSSVMHTLSCTSFAVDLSQREILQSRGGIAASSTPDCSRVSREKATVCLCVFCNNRKKVAQTVG